PIVLEMNIFHVRGYPPGKVQRMLSRCQGIACIQRDAKVLRTNGLAQPEQFLRSQVLVVLYRKVHSSSFRDSRRFAQLCQDLLKKRLPATSQRAAVTTDLRSSYNGANCAST